MTPGEGERPADGGPCLPVVGMVPPQDPLRGYEVLPDPCSLSPAALLTLLHIITCSSLPRHKSIVELGSWGDGM